MELTLQPQRDDPIGKHKVLLLAYLSTQNDVRQTVAIEYFVKSAPDHQQKLQGQADEEYSNPETSQPRRLTDGFCTNPNTMMNRFNADAFAAANNLFPGHSETAVSGCDGTVIQSSEGVLFSTNNDNNSLGFWKVTFNAIMAIKTTLFINRDSGSQSDWDRITQWTVTVGNNIDVT